MSDLINRQAIIDYINVAIPNWSTDKEMALDCICNMPSAQTDMSAYSDRLWTIAYERGKAAAQPEQRWIPVSERLPETPGEYLVEYKVEEMRFHHVLYYWVKDKIWGTGWHDMGNPLDAFTDHTVDMIAWMPLPEPYREEGGVMAELKPCPYCGGKMNL